MRDKNWAVEHREGILNIAQDRQLMKWTINCVDHLSPLSNNTINEEIENAIHIGNKKIDGSAQTGYAMKAAREIIKFVKNIDYKREVAITRAAGHDSQQRMRQIIQWGRYYME
ncbi:MAG: hypothetical protein LBK73_11170 [Treponema sp.]|jgi:hypothetical protein|nr:hypothetical protein [Treponema sp.]